MALLTEQAAMRQGPASGIRSPHDPVAEVLAEAQQM
jgi:hypothetical protein